MNIDFSKVELMYVRGYYVYCYKTEGDYLYMDDAGNFIKDLEKAKQIQCIENEADKDSVQYLLDDSIYDCPKLTMAEITLRCFLELQLLPAIKTTVYEKFLELLIITCTYKGERYRVIGASTMGDFWVNKNVNCKLSDSYSERVLISECTDFDVHLKNIREHLNVTVNNRNKR